MAENLTRYPGESEEAWSARKREWAAQQSAAHGTPGAWTTEEAAREQRYGEAKDPTGFDAVRSRAASDQFLDEYSHYRPRTTPQTSVPGTMPAATGRAAYTTQVQVAPAATAAPVRVAPAVAAPVVRLDTAQSDQQREGIVSLQDQLRARAAGTAPSAAEELLRRGTAESMASQLALVAGNKGYSGAAQRAAGRNVAAIQQRGVSDAVSLRAQEQAQAEQAYGGLLTSTRAADLAAATTNAGYAQETGLTYAQATNRMAELQAQIDQQGGMFNATQKNELEKLRAQLEQGQKQFNAGQGNDMERFNAGETNKVGLGSAELRLRAQLANLDAELKARGLDDEMRLAILASYIQNQGQVLNADAAYHDYQSKTELSSKDLTLGALSGGSQAAAAAAGKPPSGAGGA